MRNFRIRLLPVFTGLLVCTSCFSPPPSSAKELRLAIAEDPTTLDTRKAGDVLSAHIQLLLFEGLVKLHPDGSVTPAQCSSYTVSSDQKTYTFRLGESGWSDGTPVSSYDFERAWKEMLSPDFPSPNAYLLYPVKGAEAAKKGLIPVENVGIRTEGPETLIVELEQATPYFLQLLSFCVFSPAPPLQTAGQGKGLLVSNGPFVLASRSPERDLLLKKNDRYSGRKEIDIESIRLIVVPDETTALRMYERGELDLIGSPFFSPPSEALERVPESEILSVPVGATTYIVFNTKRFPFSNQTLRRALSLALNREEVASLGFNGKEEAARSAVAPCLRGGKPSSYRLEDPEEAKKLLQTALTELGIGKKELEKALVYLYCSSRAEKKLAQMIQNRWLETLGLRVTLKSTERKTMLHLLQNQHYLFAQTTHRAQYCDPVSILERFGGGETGKNYSCWEHAGYKDLLSRSGSESGAERIATLELAESVLLEEMPLSPLVHLRLHYLKKPYLNNVEFSPSGGIFFERLRFEKSLP